METLGIIASIIAIVTFVWGIGKWLLKKFRRADASTAFPRITDQPQGEAEKPLEMPPQASDPAIREGMQQLYVQTFGKPATRDDTDRMLAGSLIISGVDQVTQQDLAEFERMQKAEQANPGDSSPVRRVRNA